MNRSYSKIRHIQEANKRLEKRVMSEQFLGEMTNYEKMVSMDDDDDLDSETYEKNRVISQLKDIIDNFESINCEGISHVSVQELGDERPEHDLIYCISYKGKSKEDMIDILNRKINN